MGAFLFDVDGTLVDTTYLHVLAWSRAFAEIDEPVAMAEIHRQIGRGGSDLVEELLGRPVPEVVDLHQARYRALQPEIRAFPRAGELLRAIADAGAVVVLASSAQPDVDEANRSALGAGDAVHAAVAAEDVDRAKPAPDLFQLALARSGAAAADAVCVGDSVWDVEAAEAAGLACVGLRCGGLAEAELRGAGAVEVYADPAELLQALARSSRLAQLLPGR